MRLLILPLCLALAGCLTSPDPAPSSEQQPPPAASDAAPAAQPRANQAARAASPKPTPPELDPQYTPEQRLLMIRQICWSQVDKNRGLKTVDARADWVDKCIADKRKQPLVQPASQ